MKTQFDEDRQIPTFTDGQARYVLLETYDNARRSHEAALAEAQGESLLPYLEKHIAWSESTFGHGVRTSNIANHIRKELLEVEAAPHDLEEWIDVLILAFDGAWRAGYTAKEILNMLKAKQAKNFTRKYNVTADGSGIPSEHVRDNVTARIMAENPPPVPRNCDCGLPHGTEEPHN